jgi:hypothetical protein
MHPAVSPIFNWRTRGQPMIALGFARHLAGCRPAIQQLEKLRYGESASMETPVH